VSLSQSVLSIRIERSRDNEIKNLNLVQAQMRRSEREFGYYFFIFFKNI